MRTKDPSFVAKAIGASVLLVLAVTLGLWMVKHPCPGHERLGAESSALPAVTSADPARSERERQGSSEPATEAPAPVRIYVRLEDGAPVPDAVVHGCVGDHHDLLGRSSESGVLALDRERIPTGGFELLARHGESVGRSWIRREDAEVEITLFDGGRIAGRVVALGGDPLPDATVVAFPRSLLELDGMEPMDGLRLHPETASTRSDLDGAFVISGIAASSQVYVRARRSGWVQPQRYFLVDVGVTDLVLELLPAYGVRVRFVDSEGQPVVAESRVSGTDVGLHARALDPAYRPYIGPTPFAAPEDDDPGLHHDFCCLRTELVDTSGPRILLSGAIPGFAGFETIVLAAPLQDELPEVEVRLERVPVEYGSILLTLEGLGERRFSPTQLGGHGFLELESADQRYKATVEFSPEGSCTLTGVPRGHYTGKLLLKPSEMFTSEPFPVDVRDQAVELSIPVSTSGSVEFLPATGAGYPYTRGLRLFLGVRLAPGLVSEAGGELAGEMVRFSGPPYVLPVVRGGAYVASVVEPASGAGDVEISLGEGERVRVPLAVEL